MFKGFETHAEALEWQNEPEKSSCRCECNEISNDSEPDDSTSPVDFEVYTDGSYFNGRYSYGYAFVKDGEVIYESKGVGEDLEAAR